MANEKNESIHWTPTEAIVYRVQGKIKEETGTTLPWHVLADAIYGSMNALADTMSVGDTMELPNGTTLLVEWKPGEKKASL